MQRQRVARHHAAREECRPIQSSASRVSNAYGVARWQKTCMKKRPYGFEPARAMRSRSARVVAHVLEHLDRDDAIEAPSVEKAFMSAVIDLDVCEPAARGLARGCTSRCECRVRHRDDRGRAGTAPPSTSVSEPQPQPSSRICWPSASCRALAGQRRGTSLGFGEGVDAVGPVARSYLRRGPSEQGEELRPAARSAARWPCEAAARWALHSCRRRSPVVVSAI